MQKSSKEDVVLAGSDNQTNLMDMDKMVADRQKLAYILYIHYEVVHIRTLTPKYQ